MTGVDPEIVDSDIIDAGEQQAEVAALENGEIAQQYVAAVFEGDGLAVNAGLFGNENGPIAEVKFPRESPLPQMRPGPVMLKL